MRKHLFGIGVVAALAVVGVLGATALAEHAGGLGMHHQRGQMMRKHVAAFIEDALDAAKVTPAERAQVEAARDRAFAAIEKAHQGGKGEHMAALNEAAALFEADKIDAAKVAALRGKHEAQAKLAGDAIVQSIVQAHDALTPVERKAVADYVRAHRPGPGQHMAALRGEMMKHFASARLDDALAAAQVTAAQRPQIEAARDQLFKAVEDLRPADGLHAHLEKALALFEADRIDPAAVTALRAELLHVRLLLGAPQRKALVEWARAQHGRFGHPGMHGGGPAMEPGAFDHGAME